MTKRPSTPTDPTGSPSAKRQELPSSRHWHSAPSLSLELLEKVARRVRGLSLEIGVSDEPPRLHGVYWSVIIILEEYGKGKHYNSEGPVSFNQFEQNLTLQWPDFLEVLKRGIANDATPDDMEAMVSHRVFWSSEQPEPAIRNLRSEAPSHLVPYEAQEQVIEQSWRSTFVGESPLKGLQSHVEMILKLSEAYGRYCSIVQSSGMGKSRLLDEFSKTYFLIPINLRPAFGRGYPPSDIPVRDFLRANGALLPAGEADKRIRCFLLALFDRTKDLLGTSMGSNKTERILKFRDFMSRDQSMIGPGKDRLTFFNNVVSQAAELMVQFDKPPNDEELSTALTSLLKVLNADSDETLHRVQSGAQHVDAFIVFDEAHTLADSYDEDKESRFVVLRRVLGALSTSPLFSFFLSTAGKVTQFGQPRGQDESDRINRGEFVAPRPYVAVGFDQLSYLHKFRQGQTIQDVTSLRFISHLGRPLWGSLYDNGTDGIRNGLLTFAVQKLLCNVLVARAKLTNAQIYAVLSQRLALDINSTQYPGGRQGPFEVMQTLHEQVANHMRVCVTVGDGIETLRAIASSEPMLSEAASHIMREADFSMSSALMLVLSGFCVSQGDRGELLVAALFTSARDLLVQSKRAVPSRVQLCHSFSVHDLFSHLFTDTNFSIISAAMPSLYHSKAACLPFGQVFKNTHMHFNHFIKPQSRDVINRGNLLLYLARGAAALGANSQAGFDAVYPFIYGGPELVRMRLGFILAQVKNDSKTSRAILNAFLHMDPFLCSLFHASDLEDDETFSIPIIRLLFVLRQKPDDNGIGVKQQTHKSPSGGAAEGHGLKDGRLRFTSYDFIISGLSPQVLRPVAMDSSPDSWETLLNKQQCCTWYEGDDAEVVRAQLPGCGTHDAHWTSWVEGLPDFR